MLFETIVFKWAKEIQKRRQLTKWWRTLETETTTEYKLDSERFVDWGLDKSVIETEKKNAEIKDE